MYSNIWKETLGIKVYLLWLSALTSIVTQLFKVVAFHFGLILIPITLASLMLFLLPFLGPKLPRIPCFPYLSCLGLLTWHYLSWVISKVNCTPRHFFSNSIKWQISLSHVSTSFIWPHDSCKSILQLRNVAH